EAMLLCQQASEDVEVLYSGPSFLMADPIGPLLDQDEEEALSPSSSLEGKAPASPPLSFSSYVPSLSPSLPFSASPPPSPPPNSSYLGIKDRVDSLSLPWLDTSDLLDTQVGADDDKDDAFVGMEWMSEKINLSEYDLNSLIGSSDESPSSPEDLLASLDSAIDLHLEPFDTTISTLHDSLELGLTTDSIHSLPLELPVSGAAETMKTEETPHQENVLKSEPPSPPSPASTLELGSEVDILEAEKMATSPAAAIIQDPTVSRPPPRQSVKDSPPSSDCDSDSGIESIGSSPPRHPSPPPTPSSTAGSSRTKPYSKPEPSPASSPVAKTSRVKSVSGAPKVVEKKLKKMEQNKTAATRYRQKKRFEQEKLGTELEGLEKTNRVLTEKAESISREIQYLKDLMEEVRKHRRGKSSSVA
uniref:Cyclic AMP-dependent transcription factor ATF-4 n=1 Tax=Mola mola TaxID=94237 RepID=A0A3Q3WQD0_MOLML